ncbi:MAG: AMP-binding protein [Gammaproteobacteria bacterium]
MRFFLRQVERHAGRLASLRYRTRRWTYRRFGAQAGAVAAGLSEHDVGPGDRVLLYAGDSPHWAAAYFATLARRAIVVPLNPNSTPEQLERIAASADPKLVVSSRRCPWPATPMATLELEVAIEALRYSPPSPPPNL